MSNLPENMACNIEPGITEIKRKRIRISKSLAKEGNVVTCVIIYMEKLLDSDWLRAVQFKCNTSAKSVIQCKK